MTKVERLIKKTESTTTRVALEQYEGKWRVDVRDWVKTKKYEGATAKGCFVAVEDAKALRDALIECVAVIEAEGLTSAPADGEAVGQ